MTFSKTDARNASNAYLVRVVECGGFKPWNVENAKREMRRRMANENASVTGYAGCVERFAKYFA